MLPPSLPVLILKVILVFAAAMLAGWSVSTRRTTCSPLVGAVCRLTVGAALLNVAVITASIAGLSGRLGLFAPGGLVAWRIWGALRARQARTAVSGMRVSKWAVLFLLMTCIACASYLAPLMAQGTSGYYSRGGGDHSTYLSLSDWFTKHPFWEQVGEEETVPPNPYFEVKRFVRHRQVFGWERTQPLANQYIATPFMALLPGSAEETYTASVAFYVALAGWSVVAIVGVLLRLGVAEMLWAGVFALFSNLLVFAATCHSIPLVFAISLLNVTLVYSVSVLRENEWRATPHLVVPHALLVGALFLVYPHLFVLGLALHAAVMLALGAGVKWNRMLRYYALIGAMVLALSHVIVRINIPLVLRMAAKPTQYAGVYSWTQIGAVQAGIVDFGMFAQPYLVRPGIAVVAGLAGLGVVLLLCWRGAVHGMARDRWCLGVICLVLFAGQAYYGFRGYAYQLVRFAEVTHLWVLAIAGVGAARLVGSFRSGPKALGIAGTGIVLVMMFAGRWNAVAEVLDKAGSPQTELRDSQQIRMVGVLAEEQAKWFAGERGRLIYYFGPGYGVDHAGAAVLLRSTSYLVAHGFDYRGFLAGQDEAAVWSEEWLCNSLLVVNETLGEDIVVDARPAADACPRWDFSRLHVYDTATQSVSRLVGVAWNAPQSRQVTDASERRYRYLMGRPGVLAIWSGALDTVDVSVTLHSDRANTTVSIKGAPLDGQVVRAVRRWDGAFTPEDRIAVRLYLHPGPNVLVFGPQGSDGETPWLLVSNLVVDSAQASCRIRGKF